MKLYAIHTRICSHRPPDLLYGPDQADLRMLLGEFRHRYGTVFKPPRSGKFIAADLDRFQRDVVERMVKDGLFPPGHTFKDLHEIDDAFTHWLVLVKGGWKRAECTDFYC